jgi:hypothetical protein
MSITEQTTAMQGTLKSLKELMPRKEQETFLAWIWRGADEGLLTDQEFDLLRRLFVYDSNLLEVTALEA